MTEKHEQEAEIAEVIEEGTLQNLTASLVSLLNFRNAITGILTCILVMAMDIMLKCQFPVGILTLVGVSGTLFIIMFHKCAVVPKSAGYIMGGGALFSFIVIAFYAMPMELTTESLESYQGGRVATIVTYTTPITGRVLIYKSNGETTRKWWLKKRSQEEMIDRDLKKMETWASINPGFTAFTSDLSVYRKVWIEGERVR